MLVVGEWGREDWLKGLLAFPGRVRRIERRAGSVVVAVVGGWYMEV